MLLTRLSGVMLASSGPSAKSLGLRFLSYQTKKPILDYYTSKDNLDKFLEQKFPSYKLNNKLESYQIAMVKWTHLTSLSVMICSMASIMSTYSPVKHMFLYAGIAGTLPILAVFIPYFTVCGATYLKYRYDLSGYPEIKQIEKILSGDHNQIDQHPELIQKYPQIFKFF